MMRIESLEAFGLSRELLAVWERNYGKKLLPAQAEALQKTDLLRGRSLLLFAPTGAGKTLVGEIAALQAATEGRRALYLVPTKALAEEKYALLRQSYADLGLRVLISTRDRRLDDERLLQGDFDLAVTVPEKAHYLFNLSPGVARAVGCVIVDELQMISDLQRGATLEVTLAHLLSHCPKLQLVGLSAVIDDPGPLAGWLRAEWLQIKQRPVELRQGVLADGVFRFREYNTGQVGEEPWGLDTEGRKWGEVAQELALRFAAQGEPTLLFLRDRPSVVRLALRLAEESNLPPARQTMERLEALPPTATRSRLREVAAAGVAFHSSDLQFEERRIVEEGFADGEIGLLCSTSTLALGVNLPAKNVILASERWERVPGLGRPTLRPVDRAEFENMGGRAGRPRLSEDFGRAVLLADSTFQQEALLERYTRQKFEPLSPTLGRLSPLTQLTLLCGGDGDGSTGLLNLYRHTFTAYVRGENETQQLPPVLQAALRSAVKYRLLAAGEPEGQLHVTPLGRLAASSGASLEGFYRLVRWLRESEEPPGTMALLYLAATTPEAAELFFPLGTREAQETDWLGELQAQATEPDQVLLAKLRAETELSAYQKARAAKLSLALLRWARTEATAEVEEAVRVPAGRLSVAAETLSWLVHLSAQIGAQQGWPTPWVQTTEQWSASLAAGLPAEALPLYAALHGTLNRDRILALQAAGIYSLTDMQTLTTRKLRRLLPEAQWREIPGLAEASGPTPTADEVGRPPRRLTAAGQTPPAPPRPRSRQVVLRLDPGQPDRIMFYGQEVPLRPTEHTLLAALAAEPGRCLSYERLYNIIWGPEEMVEQGQIHWHRSRLASKLRAALPAGEKLPLRTIPRRGYVLELKPEEVECPPAEALRSAEA